MIHRFGRLRGPLVAVAAIALSAGVVLGADPLPEVEAPEAAAHGALVSGAARGATPDAFPNHGAFVSCVARMDAEDVPDDLSTLTPADCEPADEPEEPVAEDGDEEVAATDTHGALVSEAAAMPTPAGFDNHGQFVRCVAHMNRGHLGPDADLSAVDLAALTPEDCEPAEDASAEENDADAATGNEDGDDGPGNGSGKGKSKANGHGKGSGG